MLKEIFNKIYSNPYLYGFTTIIEFIILYLIIYKWNPFDFNEKFPFPVIIPIFLLSLGFIQLMNILFIIERKKVIKLNNSFSNSLNFNIDMSKIPTFTNFLLKIGVTIFIFIATLFLVWGSLFLFSKFPNTINSILLSIIHVFIIITLFIFVYQLIKPIIEKLSKTYPIFNHIQKLLFFIPIFITKIIDNIKNELKLTTSNTWIILGVLIFILGLYILLPKITKFVLHSNGTTLLDKPLYLDRENKLGAHQIFFPNDEISYTYSISAWFWINPQPPNTSSKYSTYLNIFDYGGLPIVLYNPSKNILSIRCRKNLKKSNKTNKLRNYNKNKIDYDEYNEIYKTSDIKMQKWNHIVINYDKGTMDIFINGELVGSSPNISPYITYEPFSIGQYKGIQGAIQNITYKNKILLKREIEREYNNSSLFTFNF